MALQLRTTGWSIINLGTVPTWYDGLYHNINVPREIKFNDIKEGLLDSVALQNDIFNGVTTIAPTANIFNKLTGQSGLDILFSLLTEGVVPSSYTFSRTGQVGVGTWLKIGEVASNSGPHAITRPITKLKLTLSNGIYLNTTGAGGALTNISEVSLYEKVDWVTFNLIHKITVADLRSVSDISYIAVNYPAATEFCAKVTAGQATNPILTMEVM